MPLEIVSNEVFRPFQIAFLTLIGGFFTSGWMYVVFHFQRKLAPLYGAEPWEVDMFRNTWNWFMDLILNPVGSRVGTLDRSPPTLRFLCQAAFGAIVLPLMIAVEATLIVGSTGIAIAGHELLGLTFHLTTVYQLIVTLCVILTVAIMKEGNRRIKWGIRYA